jgi:iron complex outermembrane receptor protein
MLGTLLLAILLPADTIPTSSLLIDEVVVVSKAGEGQKRSAKGQVASIEEHLAELSHVDLVRRGSYAWEPVVNNMATERVSTTIDGMKIFYACTDKMDPVTSYVESSNLQSILLNSGLNGNPQSTGNIGGSLDLKLRRSGFDGDVFQLGANAGYESNGHLQVYGADGAVSLKRFYTNAGVFYRHADNYKEGGGRKVSFSQFQKVNVYDNFGIRLTDEGHDVLEGTFIYDRASNVGYPALNMDVLKAEAFITALSYRHQWLDGFLHSWETKAYYNHITHIMDDTKRPDVEIHMDMPGKSWTSGLYSLFTGSKGRHDVQANYDLYYNRLFADMTMYPGGAAPMYMVTWPDVGTLNTGVALNDRVSLTDQQSLTLIAKWAVQWQKLNNEEGYHALRVFFPGMKDSYHQVIGRIAATYQLSLANSKLSFGAGWGSRAPTVTEAYGYYLNNTFDQYDYIGNPRLKNESAIELNGNFNFSILPSFNFSLDANAFFFSNYIIGQFENRLSPMTVDAEGVKVYGNLSHATIVNTAFTADWKLSSWLTWNSRLSYAIGRDDQSDPLPLISPFAYTSSLTFSYKHFQGKAEVRGNTKQVNAGKKYGETATAAWAIGNISGQYTLLLQKHTLTFRTGVENLFDKRYSTYSDWCDIPQKGRNFYVNLSWNL